MTSDIDCGQVCPEFYFDAVEALPPVGLRVVAQPPVNVLVTDPDGRRVGFDQSTETGINEIPGATYSGPGAWPQVIQIPAALPERYKLLILGAGNGEHQVTIETVTEGGFIESTKQVQGVATKDSKNLKHFEMAAEGDLNFLTAPP